MTETALFVIVIVFVIVKGCKQHSFVLINQQSSQPTLSYRVGVIVFVIVHFSSLKKTDY